MHSVPKLVERINNALLRTGEIHWMKGDDAIDWLAPIVADAEAGFGGNLNAFEFMKLMIKAGVGFIICRPHQGLYRSTPILLSDLPSSNR